MVVTEPLACCIVGGSMLLIEFDLFCVFVCVCYKAIFVRLVEAVVVLTEPLDCCVVGGSMPSTWFDRNVFWF